VFPNSTRRASTTECASSHGRGVRPAHEEAWPPTAARMRRYLLPAPETAAVLIVENATCCTCVLFCIFHFCVFHFCQLGVICYAHGLLRDAKVTPASGVVMQSFEHEKCKSWKRSDVPRRDSAASNMWERLTPRWFRQMHGIACPCECRQRACYRAVTFHMTANSAHYGTRAMTTLVYIALSRCTQWFN
jgi:hypothetical protein